MPDLFDDGPDDTAFSLPGDEATLEQIRSAREEAPAPEVTGEPPAAETAAETEPEAPAAPAAEAVEPEAPAVPATHELTVDDPEVQAYLEKFGGDPAKALQAAVEAQRLLGRQGQELGELRSLVEQGFQTLEQRQAAAAQPQYDPDALEGWFAENPSKIPEIAAAAYYRGDEFLLDQAIVAWEEVDKAGARRFERQISVAQARAELHAETTQQTAVVAGWNEVAASFAEDHPDVEQIAPKMRELATQYPNIVSVLQSGDPTAKREVLDFLYEKASRGQETDTRARAREIAREQEQGRQEAIEAAAVASGSAVVPATTATVGDRIANEWDKADAPYTEGWNV